MWNDEIVEEVRRVRDEFAARYNYNVTAICEAMREYEKANGIQTVTRQPRLPHAPLAVEFSEETHKAA